MSMKKRISSSAPVKKKNGFF